MLKCKLRQNTVAFIEKSTFFLKPLIFQISLNSSDARRFTNFLTSMPPGSDHGHHFGTKFDASSPSRTPITLLTKNAAGNQFYKGFLRIPKNYCKCAEHMI